MRYVTAVLSYGTLFYLKTDADSKVFIKESRKKEFSLLVGFSAVSLHTISPYLVHISMAINTWKKWKDR